MTSVDLKEDEWMMFPLQNPEVTCGLRVDLPKKERVHQLTPLGPDIRNMGTAGFQPREIYACRRCGKDITRKPTWNENQPSEDSPAQHGT